MDFYKTPRWIKLRYLVLREYGKRCCMCGRTPDDGVAIQVDHIKPRSKYPDLQWNWDNLQVLCRDCNLGKSNYYTDDWRKEALPPPRRKTTTPAPVPQPVPQRRSRVRRSPWLIFKLCFIVFAVILVLLSFDMA